MPVSDLISSIEHKPAAHARESAAILIQRTWRARKNWIKDKYLTPDTRWDDILTSARLEVARENALEGCNSPKRRWKRAVLLIGQLRAQHPLYSHGGTISLENESLLKELEGQHWLELIDGMHRYGSNLKVGFWFAFLCDGYINNIQWYHQEWQQADTRQNFFKWLDSGGGKDLSLKECTRERLDLERIIYLSVEQRLNYLVTITSEGKLIWAKNNQPVDTSAGEWKDSGGGGIVSERVPTMAEGAVGRWPVLARDANDENDTQKNEVFAQPFDCPRVWRAFVAKDYEEEYLDIHNVNLFIGIKETGYFQHSSFLAGGIVTSAGLIKVKHGEIKGLSPLSGHYRTSVDHFKKFVEVLGEKGVDLSRVSISKAEIALWGIEQLAYFKKKPISKGKEKVKNIPENVRHAVLDQEHHLEAGDGQNRVQE